MYLFSAYAHHFVFFYVCACVYDLYIMCVCACLFFFVLFFFLCNKLEFRWLYLAHTSKITYICEQLKKNPLKIKGVDRHSTEATPPPPLFGAPETECFCTDYFHTYIDYNWMSTSS